MEDIKLAKSRFFAAELDRFNALKTAGNLAEAEVIANQINDGWLKILGKRGVTTAKNLSRAQADELIKKLGDAVAERERKKKDSELNDWANQQVAKNLASGQQKPTPEAATTGKV